MASTSPATHPLSEPLIELIAGRFRVLAEPMRIKLLDQLLNILAQCVGLAPTPVLRGDELPDHAELMNEQDTGKSQANGHGIAKMPPSRDQAKP